VAASATPSGLAVSITTSGVCSGSGTGSASVLMTSGTGACTVHFNQAGDSNYNPAPEVTENVAALKAAQTITFGALSDKTYGDADFAVSATASSSLPVSFTASGDCTVSGNTVHITGAGSCTIRASQAGNTNYNAAPDVDRSFSIDKAQLSVIADNKSVQYSDPEPLYTVTYSGFVNGDDNNDLQGTRSCITTAPTSLAADNTPVIMAEPGNYPITCQASTLASANYEISYVDGILEVTQEDARTTYTGATFASTVCPTCSNATVTLSATIQDITAFDPSLSPPEPDTYPGDIRNATVTFVDRNDNNAVLCQASVGLVSLNDTMTGTATCNWHADIGSADSQSYTIGVIVDGYYTSNSSADDTVVTVSKPLTTSFITGGGFLILENSAGQKAGDKGTKNNFGFNVKYNKSGKNLQGNINSIIRKTEADGVLHVYQIKGNSMTSLSVKTTGTGGYAVFNGKANLQDITNPSSPVSVDGNATLQVTMTDNGDQSIGDSIGITVWNKAGGLWYSSNWQSASPPKTVEQTLGDAGGGNLVVH
jgi:MBG domain (YGX type)